MKKLALLVLVFMSLTAFARPITTLRPKNKHTIIYSTAEFTSNAQLKAAGLDLRGLLAPSWAEHSISYMSLAIMTDKKYEAAVMVATLSFEGSGPEYSISFTSIGEIKHNKKSGEISFLATDGSTAPLSISGAPSHSSGYMIFNIQDSDLNKPFAVNTPFSIIKE
jgi:hypothetical protein